MTHRLNHHIMKSRFLFCGMGLYLVGCSSSAQPTAAITQPLVQASVLAPVVTAAQERAVVTAPPFIDLATVDVTVENPPSPDEPVVVAAALDRATVRAGEFVTLVVRMVVHPAWHSYAVTGPTGVSLPTQLKLALPDGIAAAADWQNPEPTMIDSIEGEIAAYVGELRFGIPLQIDAGTTPGVMTIKCSIRFQACDHNSCLPPTTKTIEVPIDIVAAQ